MERETFSILVVDDEFGIRAACARVLNGFSVTVPDANCDVQFEISHVECAEDALDVLAESPPHIMLLDNKLPGMSGLQLLERLHQEKSDTLVIMITAYASIETVVRATKQGAYDFIPKPFTPAELKATLRKAAQHLVIARQARMLAAEKRKVRFQFISVLAHELKAPLSAVEEYLRVLRERSLGDDQEVYDQMLDRCLTRAEYMRKMIIDLLDLTRIESGEKRRRISRVDVAEAARGAIENIAPAAGARCIGVELHQEAPVYLQADYSEIAIILNNLLSNAEKYNRADGRIDVYLERRETGVRIRVADQGIGMSGDECAQLYQDFVRIRNHKTKGILGSGLGLSIVKKLTHLYHGEISVSSEPDVGTTFTVELEDAPTPEQLHSSAANAGVGESPHKAVASGV